MAVERGQRTRERSWQDYENLNKAANEARGGDYHYSLQPLEVLLASTALPMYSETGVSSKAQSNETGEAVIQWSASLAAPGVEKGSGDPLMDRHETVDSPSGNLGVVTVSTIDPEGRSRDVAVDVRTIDITSSAAVDPETGDYNGARASSIIWINSGDTGKKGGSRDLSLRIEVSENGGIANWGIGRGRENGGGYTRESQGAISTNLGGFLDGLAEKVSKTAAGYRDVARDPSDQ